MARVLLISLICGVASALGLPALAQSGDPAPTTQAASPVQTLLSILKAEKVTQKDRDEAARRLLVEGSPDILVELKNVLIDVGNPSAQLSTARAIASASDPDAAFIDPLFALLTQGQKLVEAATDALQNYQSSPDVLSRLINTATSAQQRDSVRLSSIKAIASFPDKRAADALMGLLTNPDGLPAIRAAAASALGRLSGRTDFGEDEKRWQEWWMRMSQVSDADWRARALALTASRLARSQNRYDDLADETAAFLQDGYRSAADSQKADMMLRMLRSSEPAIRAIGARTISAEQSEGRPVPPPAREALRDLIGDSDKSVRIDAISALAASNDTDALEALLAQLEREIEPDVQAIIAVALAPMRDLRAVPPLLKMLDRGPAIGIASADALREMGETLRRDDAGLAEQTALTLRAAYERVSRASAPESLRAALLEAMVPLRSSRLLDLFLKILEPATSPRLRRIALHGLGELGNRNTADTVATWLEDKDDGVRLEAVDALGKTAGFEYGEKLYARMNETVETNAQIRQRAWEVFNSLLPAAPIDQLQNWADRFSKDPAKRLPVLEALRDKLIEQRDDSSLAIKRQEIGEEQMKLGQYAEAVLSFRPALDYWQGQRNPNQQTIEKLTAQIIEALLRSKQYPESAQFAAAAITRSVTNQETVGKPIRSEAERLRDASLSQDCLQLIREVKQMTPPLDARYLDVLKQIETAITKKPA